MANSINTSIEKHRVSKVWHGVVNVAVIEATNLTSPKNNSFPDPFVRLKLGIDKFRTKVWIFNSLSAFSNVSNALASTKDPLTLRLMSR